MPDPAKALFVRIDTRANLPALGKVATAFLGAWSPALRTLDTGARAVAGRSSVRITPLAICALSTVRRPCAPIRGRPSKSEALEFGFRRGVAYNLFKLNPHGADAEHFLLNPLGPLGAIGASQQISDASVEPFICSGSMLHAALGGQRIHAHRPFPTALWPVVQCAFQPICAPIAATRCRRRRTPIFARFRFRPACRRAGG